MRESQKESQEERGTGTEPCRDREERGETKDVGREGAQDPERTQPEDVDLERKHLDKTGRMWINCRGREERGQKRKRDTRRSSRTRRVWT